MTAGPRWSARKVDRLRQLRAFCQVAAMKSITQGAAAIGLSQPTASAHIRELELEMQATLLDRYGPRIDLTPAGECLYEIARPLVERLERMSADLAARLDESVSGELRVGAGAAGISFILPPIARRFRDAYPGIRLCLESVRTDDSYELLEEGKVDLIFGVQKPADDRFIYHRILEWELVLITPRNHPLAGRQSVDIREIAGYPGIVPPARTYSRDFGEAIARRFGVTVNVGIETSGWILVKTFVEAGLGISVVPSVCVSEERDRLAIIPFGKYAKPGSYGVTVRRDVPLSPPARRFLEMMDPECPCHQW